MWVEPRPTGKLRQLTIIVVLKGLKMMLEGVKGSGIDGFPGILWSSRTIVREAIGQTPFNLVYENEAILHVEVGIPSLRITFYDQSRNEEEKRFNLDLLPETRGNVLLRAISYKLRLTRLFNRRGKHQPLQDNDWVLRKFEATWREPRLGKLQPNWEGPYKVTKVVHLGTYRLEDQEGRELPRSWNTDNIRKFYI